MSADRRTLTIGAVAMVLLVAVGVVSASIFARGGCVAVPEATAPATEARADVGAALGDHLDVAGDELAAAIEAATGRTATSVTPVAGAEVLRGTATGTVAAGTGATLLGPDGDPLAALELGEIRLLGGGDGLYALGFVNEDTGQATAITPVAGHDLAVGTCLDTAVVGELFAFHLDARDGELLLLRTDDDADNTEIEVRDAAAGRVWTTPLELGFGSPGVVADRTTAALGTDTIVLGRRTAADDDLPAVIELDREDGTVRGQLSAADLADAADLPVDGATRWEVVAAGEDVAYLTATSDHDDAGPPVLLTVQLDLAQPVAARPLPGPVVAAAVGSDDRVVLLARDGDRAELLELGPDGEVTATTGTAPDVATVAALDGGALTVLDGQLTGPDGAADLPDGIEVLDLLVTDDRVAVLLGHDDEARDPVLVLLT
ncbi:hypothetical protein FTX61_20945 [Nitriliruptoraceae bacterium ZYF776]|nr:hypothetical protein [Profundirhabdus halotolerans]